MARSGIRVNCVAPGLVETDMIADLDAEVKREMIRAIPMRRVGEADEVAAAIAFLLERRRERDHRTGVVRGRRDVGLGIGDRHETEANQLQML